MEQGPSDWQSFLKQHVGILLIGCVGLMFCGYGLMGLLGKNDTQSDITFVSAATAGQPNQQSSIMIDIAGAVVKPGVYTFSQEARLQDALMKAGGLSEEADREKISRTMNLATKLTDGMKVYFPAVGDTTTTILGESTSEAGQININSASSATLEKLPGIGPVTAQKIIDARPYSRIEELTEKSVVTKKIFEQIKSTISIL